MQCRHRIAIVAAAGVLVSTLPAVVGAQQFTASRLAILQAEDRRAMAPADLARLRLAVRGGDAAGARLAVRALGRLERPALVVDILPALDSRVPEIRAEAANAVAQAAAGARHGQSGGPTPAALLQTLRSRLASEADGTVRAALVEAIARLPFSGEGAEGAAAAQAVLVNAAGEQSTVDDRLGLARAYEVLVRLNKGMSLTPASHDFLRRQAGVGAAAGSVAGGSAAGTTGRNRPADVPRDARVRRLALEALTTAGALDPDLIALARTDSDVQVRRLAMRGAARAHLRPVVLAGLEDVAPMVRLEAVRGLPGLSAEDECAWTLAATADTDPHVVLQAIDQLRGCGHWDQAVTRLVDLVADATALAAPRRWHQPAHALVALAAAAPERARQLLQSHATALTPFVRVYAARAAAELKDRETLERLAADSSDNVVEAAVDALAAQAGGEATPRYLAVLDRPGYQAIRAAARALASASARSDKEQVVAALKRTYDRLTREGHENSTDARSALAGTLETLGAPTASVAAAGRSIHRPIDPTLEELRRLAAPRARFTLRGLGIIDVALITSEAPLTVVQMARLAESGYFNGLTIHRVVPNFVLQGGSPDANEYVGHPDYMRDEVGVWPHVRGALGISTRGRDTGDAQFFIDMVDNPRLDHEYTVFGQVIAGMDVAERVLEGDVIESVQILAK